MQIRSAAEIFEDLRDLCREPGFLHALSSIIFRDFFGSVDSKGAIISPTSDERHSRSRLINNELMLLVGLLVQSNGLRVLDDAGETVLLVERADRLLEELHAHMETPMREALHNPTAIGQLSPDQFGAMFREAIYYGADSAFDFQYQRFARHRYREDYEWLLSNKGISIGSMIDIARYVANVVHLQLNYLITHFDVQSATPSPIQLSSAFAVPKKLLTQQFKGKALPFLQCFSIPVNNSNHSFCHPTAYNKSASCPIIDLGSSIYLCSSYKLFESIYESPYYWMQRDSQYVDIASDHRGQFLEKSIAAMARKVFGAAHVFPNATVRTSGGRVVSEADVLIVYGEFILVIQAKSKRLTIEARSGDPARIQRDFQASVQAAYEQAVNFIELIIGGAECDVGDGDRRTFRWLARVFPMVVLSDHFPSLTLLTNDLIKRRDGYDPVVVDIFFFDVLFALLDHPVDALYYLQQRARFFDRLGADSEFDVLGYHLAQKLYVPDDCHGMTLDRSFGSDINDFFVSKDAGVPCSINFPPLEERVDVPMIRDLISALKAGPPEVAGTAIELLDFSEEALQKMADTIAMVREEVKSGKPFKAFSVETYYGGISYVAVDSLNARRTAVAEAVARKQKYTLKKDRWYVLLDNVRSSTLIDGILPLCETWTESGEMEEFLQDIGPLFKSTPVPFRKAGPVEEHKGE